jgi:hypothetical protein
MDLAAMIANDLMGFDGLVTGTYRRLSAPGGTFTDYAGVTFLPEDEAVAGRGIALSRAHGRAVNKNTGARAAAGGGPPLQLPGGRIFHCRASELPFKPARGDRIDFGGTLGEWEVQSSSEETLGTRYEVLAVKRNA